jgi:hypothetical protein
MNATIKHAIQEILHLSTTGTRLFTLYKGLLMVINEYIRRDPACNIDVNLSLRAVFPVTQPHTLGSSREVVLKERYDIWYIPDRESLKDCFKSRVCLLEFTAEETRKFEPFIRAMSLKHRLLSEAVTETTETSGDPIFDQETTEDLLVRIPYLIL